MNCNHDTTTSQVVGGFEVEKKHQILFFECWWLGRWTLNGTRVTSKHSDFGSLPNTAITGHFQTSSKGHLETSPFRVLGAGTRELGV